MLIPFREITIEMNLYLKDQIYWNLNIPVRTKRIIVIVIFAFVFVPHFSSRIISYLNQLFFFLEFLMKICNIKNNVLVWLAMTTISLLLQVV